MGRKAVIIGIVGVIIVAILAFAYFSNGSETSPRSSPDADDRTIIFDENSLLNRGVTSGQLANLEQVLQQYFNSQGKVPDRIDFNTIYRVPPNPKNSTPFTEITFVVQPDGKPVYKAKMDAFGSSEIRLYLYTLDGNTLVYDSQNVGSSSDE